MTRQLWALVWCSGCRRYVREVVDRGGVAIVEVHDQRRGIPCTAGGIASASAITRALVEPLTVAR